MACSRLAATGSPFRRTSWYGPDAISPGWRRAWTGRRSPPPTGMRPRLRYGHAPKHRPRPWTGKAARRLSSRIRSTGGQGRYRAPALKVRLLNSNHDIGRGFPNIRSSVPQNCNLGNLPHSPALRWGSGGTTARAPARMNFHVNDIATVPDFLAGGGEMGAAMRAFDWASAPLGPADGWSATLRTCLRIMLASRQPMWLWWGPELINFYNDAYLPIIGTKHPAALGRPAKQVWAEIWEQIEGRIAAAMKGESSYSETELLVMSRKGYPEETYYTFSYSPVREQGGSIGGIVCASSDDTDRVIEARRLAQ